MTFERLCDADSLADGEMLAVAVSGHDRVAVYRVGDAVFCTQDACTHAEASLTEGYLDGDRVVCPVHGAEFSVRTGEALTFPAETPLRVFATRLEDGAIWADLSTAPACADCPERRS